LIEVLVAGIRVDTVEVCGVAQPQVTITYRFDKPNQVERVAPIEGYLAAPLRIPTTPQSVGDHLRLRRLQLKLLQKEVAARLRVHKGSIANWEANLTQPSVEYMPAIRAFLGYDPLPPAQGWAARLVRGRTVLGFSQQRMAAKLEVDPGTLARWERGEREPHGELAARAEKLLAGAETLPEQGRRAG